MSVRKLYFPRQISHVQAYLQASVTGTDAMAPICSYQPSACKHTAIRTTCPGSYSCCCTHRSSSAVELSSAVRVGCACLDCNNPPRPHSDQYAVLIIAIPGPAYRFRTVAGLMGERPLAPLSMAISSKSRSTMSRGWILLLLVGLMRASCAGKPHRNCWPPFYSTNAGQLPYVLQITPVQWNSQ